VSLFARRFAIKPLYGPDPLVGSSPKLMTAGSSDRLVIDALTVCPAQAAPASLTDQLPQNSPGPPVRTDSIFDSEKRLSSATYRKKYKRYVTTLGEDTGMPVTTTLRRAIQVQRQD